MQIAVLPDAARVEERLARLARQRGFVAGKVACSLAELERGLVREAQQAGACPQIASPFALQLALREAARTHSPGPYFAIRNHAGYARALGDLLSALTHGLLPPLELTSLDAPERTVALGRTLLAARQALDQAGVADPHLALCLAIEHVERGGALPAHVAAAAAPAPGHRPGQPDARPHPSAVVRRPTRADGVAGTHPARPGEARRTRAGARAHRSGRSVARAGAFPAPPLRAGRTCRRRSGGAGLLRVARCASARGGPALRVADPLRGGGGLHRGGGAKPRLWSGGGARGGTRPRRSALARAPGKTRVGDRSCAPRARAPGPGGRGLSARAADRPALFAAALPAGDTRAGDTRAGDTRAGDTRAGDTRAGDTI